MPDLTGKPVPVAKKDLARTVDLDASGLDWAVELQFTNGVQGLDNARNVNERRWRVCRTDPASGARFQTRDGSLDPDDARIYLLIGKIGEPCPDRYKPRSRFWDPPADEAGDH